MGASSTCISKAKYMDGISDETFLTKIAQLFKSEKKTGYGKLKICHGVSSLPLLHLLPWLSTNLSDDLSPVTQTDQGNYIVVTDWVPKTWILKVLW